MWKDLTFQQKDEYIRNYVRNYGYAPTEEIAKVYEQEEAVLQQEEEQGSTQFDLSPELTPQEAQEWERLSNIGRRLSKGGNLYDGNNPQGQQMTTARDNTYVAQKDWDLEREIKEQQWLDRISYSGEIKPSPTGMEAVLRDIENTHLLPHFGDGENHSMTVKELIENPVTGLVSFPLRLATRDGVYKTGTKLSEGDYEGALYSALGDALDLAPLAGKASQLAKPLVRNYKVAKEIDRMPLREFPAEEAKPVVRKAVPTKKDPVPDFDFSRSRDNAEFIKKYKEFADRYGYDVPNLRIDDIEGWNKEARKMLDRHNTFLRGVNSKSASKKDIEMAKEALGDNFTEEDFIKYASTNSRNGREHFVGGENALNYGAGNPVAMVQYPYRLGENRLNWFAEGDTPIYFSDTRTGQSLTPDTREALGFRGIVSPWQNSRYGGTTNEFVIDTPEPLVFKGFYDGNPGGIRSGKAMSADKVYGYSQGGRLNIYDGSNPGGQMMDIRREGELEEQPVVLPEVVITPKSAEKAYRQDVVDRIMGRKYSHWDFSKALDLSEEDGREFTERAGIKYGQPVDTEHPIWYRVKNWFSKPFLCINTATDAFSGGKWTYARNINFARDYEKLGLKRLYLPESEKGDLVQYEECGFPFHAGIVTRRSPNKDSVYVRSSMGNLEMNPEKGYEIVNDSIVERTEENGLKERYILRPYTKEDWTK